MDAAPELAAALERGEAGGARRAAAEVPATGPVRDVALEVLATAARDGDELATELLVELVDRTGLARAAARRFLVDASAVDEVANDVLVVVASSLDRFRGEARFTTWLHGIARHRAIDHLRAQRDERIPPAPSPARRLSSVIAARAAVEDLLAQLPEDYGRAVALRDVEQLPYAEVAVRLGCPQSTARTRVARGRALVARRLGEDDRHGVGT